MRHMAAKRITDPSYGVKVRERKEGKGQNPKEMIVMEERVYASTCSLRTSA